MRTIRLLVATSLAALALAALPVAPIDAAQAQQQPGSDPLHTLDLTWDRWLDHPSWSKVGYEVIRFAFDFRRNEDAEAAVEESGISLDWTPRLATFCELDGNPSLVDLRAFHRLIACIARCCDGVIALDQEILSITAFEGLYGEIIHAPLVLEARNTKNQSERPDSKTDGPEV